MCRLLYLPSGVRPPKKMLRAWLVSLDKSFGGDGCGWASRKAARKGVNLTPAESADALGKARGDMVWHTRRISCGAGTDALCHPFDTGDGFLVHNGHWRQGVFTASMLEGSWSDTAVAARYIHLYGWEKFTDVCDAGVWLHLTPKGVQVHLATGDLWVERLTGTLCSEPLKGWGIWSRAEPGTYDVGDDVPVRAPMPERAGGSDLLWDRLHLPVKLGV